MDYQPLGNTGLSVSVLGIGTGGPSRVGLRTGGTQEDAARLIRAAIDHGVNVIDTAEAYGTEPLVGCVLQDLPRDEVVVSTKISHWENLAPRALQRKVDERLQLLRTDYVDICHLHAVRPEQYPYVVEQLYPALLRAKEAGKIRLLGVTEMFNQDPAHQMLAQAVADRIWDVLMVGFSILNQSARGRVLKAAQERGTGILGMFAVRLALSRRQRLAEVINELVEQGVMSRPEIAEAGGTPDDPLRFVAGDPDVQDLVEAAYRFVRHEPGIHVTLSGTGDHNHLMANLSSAQCPPLSPALYATLRSLFRNVDSVTGQ